MSKTQDDAKPFLSDEERRKIYEEEKARAEARKSLETPQPRKKTSSCLLILVGIVVLAIIGGCIHALSGGSSSPSSSSGGLPDGPGGGGVGVDAKLSSGSKSVVLGRTEDAEDALTKAAIADDEPGFNLLIASDQAFIVPEGTKVHTIDRSFTLYQVRIIDGAHTMETGWVPTEYVKPL
jgi:hypothetical protein